MARYFLHLRDGTNELLDPEGREFWSPDALRNAVLFTARDILAADLRNGLVDLRFRIDAQDVTGAIVYSLPFKHAFSMVPEDAETSSSLPE
jgi:hypothetical protein